LDGLPLAIELAAARVKLLSTPELRARLERRLPLLIGGPRDTPARLQTMRDAIAWSHDLLSPEGQVHFRRLAVFVDGFTMEAAEAVVPAAGDMSVDVLDGLAWLLDASLLTRTDDVGGTPRYGMLETIREFALECLEASDDETPMRQAHAVWCLAFAEAANSPRRFMVDVEAADRLAVEHDNLRAALSRLDRVGDAEGLLRLAVAMSGLWMFQSHSGEARRWLERALMYEGTKFLSARASALLAAAMFAHYHRDTERAVALAEQSLALRRTERDLWGGAHARLFVAVLVLEDGQYDRAAEHVEASMADLAALDEPSWLEALSIHLLGVIAFAQGDLDGAVARLDEALTGYREQANRWSTAMALDYLGVVATARGDLVIAAGCHQESIGFWQTVGSKERLAEWLARVAILACAIGQAKLAVRFAAAAEAARDEAGWIWVLPERLTYERTAQELREALGDEAFGAAWAAGIALMPKEAAAQGKALLAALLSATPKSASRATLPFGLTSREQDVLRLLVEGRSDRQIAEALFIGPRTVQTHVANLFAKLSVHTRAEAAAMAVRRGLV
jgi:DNA-binding CsgD family transcriptional regulator